MSLLSFFQRDNGVKNLNSTEFEEALKSDKNAVLIDCRTKAEHKEVRIPKSKLIDLMSPTFQDEISALDKSKNYYIYCRSGNRSYHAGKSMSKLGFENVSHLSPGIIGWQGPTE
ncbi:MAG: rhodanese-like domain-containing protein [Melioribacteraceae bacterium]|nr:rhodanese-like domain-containing protein [Melioribacteraceae bacterium]MCF8265980.1 rhodanese-like domain-containing protein [Melioribacteraceae bacterium]MCF8412542.1 rhodanese-like domain-containing protein [Melioribacteraceae bacterium]